MNKQQRINWKQGMEITPEIFIESDNYHIAERQLLGTLLASRLYGIFPDSKFTMHYEIHNQEIVIQISNCIALLSNGDVINIQRNISFNKALPIDETAEYYAILSQKHIDENELHIVPQYDISFKKTNEPIDNGIPVLKLFRNDVDANYIPPSIALNSVDLLMNKYIEIKNIIHKTFNYYPENDLNYLLLTLLQLELNNLSSKESPETLVQLMKKFCLVFQTHLKIGPLQSVKKFTDILYNHHEIGKTLDTGYAGLMEILQILETEPIPEIEEIKI
jgi:predicted component of type VI protein secretion system